MFAFLLARVFVTNRISTPIIRNAHEQFIKYSSVSQIHGNRIIKDSLSVAENDTITSVTKLLKSYDFTDTQIANFFIKFQINPSHNPTNVMKPKLDFFLAIGFSNTQLAKFISFQSRILQSSLEKRIKPNAHLLKSFYETEEHLICALIRTHTLLTSNLETNFFPNVRTLTDHGVSHTNILKLAKRDPRKLLYPKKKFKGKVQIISSMGFNPCSNLFCRGLIIITGVSTALWKKKVCLYKSLGWSEEDVLAAFIRQPECMCLSEKKIKRMVDFFVNQRHWEPSDLVKNPVLMNLNLEKRIMPRGLVIDILVKKQLVKKFTAAQCFISGKDFMEKYVKTYQDQAPEFVLIQK